MVARGSRLLVRFTQEDLARTRVLDEPDPMWELALSLHALPACGRLGAHTAWRRAVSSRFTTADAERAEGLLRTLVPARGNFPDFLTPPPAGPDLANGLDALRGTPRRQLRADLSSTRLRRPTTAYTRALAGGDREAMNDLVWALRRHFDLALAPHWAQIRDELAADHASRTRQATRGGLERMLGGFGPSVRWRWPYLEADYPREHRIDLAGRGLTLIPSYFCTGTVVTLIDPELRPVLVYPAIRQVADPAALDRALWRLTGVLSRTRASILVALRVPLSTSDLASTIGMSLASASQQVTLLRKAGLVTSTRHGQAVIHALTPLGKALLEAR